MPDTQITPPASPIIIPPIDPNPLFSWLPAWLRHVAQQLLQALILAAIGFYAVQQVVKPTEEKLSEQNATLNKQVDELKLQNLEIRKQTRAVMYQAAHMKAQSEFWGVPAQAEMSGVSWVLLEPIHRGTKP